MRAVFEMLGIKDVVSKSIGSQNPYNMIRATLNGLTKESSPVRLQHVVAKKLLTSCARTKHLQPQTRKESVPWLKPSS